MVFKNFLITVLIAFHIIISLFCIFAKADLLLFGQCQIIYSYMCANQALNLRLPNLTTNTEYPFFGFCLQVFYRTWPPHQVNCLGWIGNNHNGSFPRTQRHIFSLGIGPRGNFWLLLRKTSYFNVIWIAFCSFLIHLFLKTYLYHSCCFGHCFNCIW